MLENGLARLRKGLEELEQRLCMVLRPPCPTAVEPQGVEKNGGTCGLSGILNDRATDLEELIRHVDGLRNRLEL